MPDLISATDQALIAQAISAGRVTICPPVQFKPVPSKFNIPPDTPLARGTTPEVAARRAKLLALANGRKGVSEIADLLGVRDHIVHCDIYAMRQAGTVVPMPGRSFSKKLKSWGWRG